MVALFVLAAFIFFIITDLIVLKMQGKTHPAFEKVLSLAGFSFLPDMDIKVPEGIMLSKGHLWIQKNKSGLVRLGVDEFTYKALGNISLQNKLEAGKELKRGEVIFEGAVGNKKFKFRSPVSGVIKSVNFSHDRNSDPYNNWNVEISAKDFTPGNGLFFSGKDAINWLNNEFIKLDNFLMMHSDNHELAGVTMYDGGRMVEGASAELINGAAEDFEKEFLSI